MLLAKNRKALFNYEIVEKYVAGISLYGYEVKAIREGNVSFEGSYITVNQGEAYVTNLYISDYSKQSQESDDFKRRRNRKLLLNKKELEKIEKEIAEKGKSAVPLALVLNKNLIKLELAVVKGRKEFEKKVVAKEKQIKKDLEVARKELGI